jgi:two-component sensor histidine kinase
LASIPAAIQHSRPVGGGGTVLVTVSSRPDEFSVSVSDLGGGPDPAQTTFGLGTRLIGALARQLNAKVAKQKSVASYSVTVKFHISDRVSFGIIAEK